MEKIVGTAGHIDHGKTAVVKALTGIDADRLPEEKRRGITIDLGFAEMSVGETHFGFVDVPGHERFVKNMLAGASGIDLVLLIIAADESVMPQTREHFEICRLLGIRAGIVVLTKTDLVDSETLELAKIDAAGLVSNSFLQDSPVVCVSSRNGDGIEELKDLLVQTAVILPTRNDQLVTRLPIDRSFSIKGFGAVATGTLASGELTEGTEMELLPERLKVRIRGLQTHGKSVKSATFGQRVAVNIGGIDHSKVIRGMVLAAPNILSPTQMLDTMIEVLSDAPQTLRSRQRVRIHVGTVEALARIHVLNDTGEIAAGEKDFVQIRLETAVVAVPGERFIVRSYSPQTTIAGGEILDPLASKHRRKDFETAREFLRNLQLAVNDNAGRVRLFINAAGRTGASFNELQSRTALRKAVLEEALNANFLQKDIIDAGGRYLASETFNSLSKAAEGTLTDFHKYQPLAKGMSREALREKVFAHLPDEILQAVIESLERLGKIISDKDTLRLLSYQISLSPVEAAFSKAIFEIYKTTRLEVPKLDEVLNTVIDGTLFSFKDARKYFQLFLDAGEIVKVTEELYFERSAINDLIVLMKEFAGTTPTRTIDVPQFKEIAGISRKYAIPLLEYFDREKVTVRSGDKRVIL